jgi:hypothetical protein
MVIVPSSLCTERAFKDELRSRAFRGSATGTCARVPADQSARRPRADLRAGITTPRTAGAAAAR